MTGIPRGRQIIFEYYKNASQPTQSSSACCKPANKQHHGITIASALDGGSVLSMLGMWRCQGHLWRSH